MTHDTYIDIHPHNMVPHILYARPFQDAYNVFACSNIKYGTIPYQSMYHLFCKLKNYIPLMYTAIVC